MSKDKYASESSEGEGEYADILIEMSGTRIACLQGRFHINPTVDDGRGKLNKCGKRS